MKVSRCFDTASRATAVYTLVALATTWPLALHLTTAVPADLGDPLLNAFIIDGGITQLGSLLSGDLSAFSRFWHAPIFHPEPLTLAYSEHLAAQALQAAPLYAAPARAGRRTPARARTASGTARPPRAVSRRRSPRAPGPAGR